MTARSSNRTSLVLVAAFLLAAFAASVAHADYVGYAVTKKGEFALPESLDEVDTEQLINVKWGEYSGPQSRVGVLEVDNNSSTGSFKVSGPDGQVVSYSVSDFQNQVPVNGIEAMIADAMFRTGRFRLVERTVLDEVLREQDLAASGRVSQQSGAQTGKVLGAQYLVQGVVTAYEPNFKGKKGGLGGITRGLLGGAKVGKTKSMIGMNFRLIDAETGELAFTKQVDVIISKQEFDMGGIGWGGGGALGGFFSTFSKTPIGQATMSAVNIGVFELIKQIGAAPVQGSVVKVDGTKVFVNLGSDFVEVGSVLTAVAKGEELIDPDTGLSLGGEDEELGTLRVGEVHEKYCIAEAQGFDPSALQRGDKVVSSQKPIQLEFAPAWQGKKRKG